MIVLDASAAAGLLLNEQPVASRVWPWLERADGAVYVPHAFDLEVLCVIRGHERGGRITAETATIARTALAELPLIRWSHLRLAPRIWALRHNLTVYDAACAALAEPLDAPLVTSDRALTAVPGLRAAIEFCGS